MQNDLDWFCGWVAKHCDDEWEHGYPVILDTYDNPGWRLRVNLENSAMRSRQVLPLVDGLPGDDRWFSCRIDGGMFHGACDLAQLPRLLKVFREWAEMSAE